MIQINNIKLPADKDISFLQQKISKILRLKENNNFTYKILKKSIDARGDVVYVIYNVAVDLLLDDKVSKISAKKEAKIVAGLRDKNVIIKKEEGYTFKPSGSIKLEKRPVIVGSGPAGLFCAYMLACNGYNPLIIERGSKVEERKKKVEAFWNGEKLDEECNVQFGEGGAGTFSDGKLNTLVKDKDYRGRLVLETFVKYGAKENIMYDAKPHIGTDYLYNILINMRNDIIAMGGEFMFDTLVEDIVFEDSIIKQVILRGGKTIDTDVVVLAIGHSSRDTFSMLKEKNISMVAKSFAVGVRVEHPQKLIGENQYGKYASCLPAASYKLTHQASTGRGVYSFCMCPGGVVVNASSEEGHIAVNGMSYNSRDGQNANSAIIVTVNPKDFDTDDIMAGVRFQRKLEEAAYKEGKGKIPVQLFGDFESNRSSTALGSITPCIKGGYTLANLNNCFPKYICDTIVEGMHSFDKKIKGFAAKDVVLSGVESRTSSPIRIVRDDERLESVSVSGLYPCGEGAGYAGGIMSAAIDGIKVYEKIASKYLNIRNEEQHGRA